MLGPKSAISGFEYRVDYLKVKSGAELISFAGFPLSAVERAIRRFSAEAIIYHREERGGGANAHRLYAPSDIAAGAICFALTSDLGIQDREALRLIATELYRVDDGIHSITRAIAAMRGDLPHARRVCVINVEMDAYGNRQFAVALADPEAISALPNTRSAILVDLTSLLAPLIEWLDSEIARVPPKVGDN